MKKSLIIIISTLLILIIPASMYSYTITSSYQGNIPDDYINGAQLTPEAQAYLQQHGGDSSPSAAPKHTHNYTSTVTKEATCSEKGVMTYTCEGCGNSYTQPIPKTEHKWVETVITPATCSTEGEVKKVCSVCGTEEIEKTPADSSVHDYEEVIVMILVTPGQQSCNIRT